MSVQFCFIHKEQPYTLVLCKHCVYSQSLSLGNGSHIQSSSMQKSFCWWMNYFDQSILLVFFIFASVLYFYVDKRSFFCTRETRPREKKHDLYKVSSGTHPSFVVPGKQKVKRSIQNTPLCYNCFFECQKIEQTHRNCCLKSCHQ